MTYTLKEIFSIVKNRAKTKVKATGSPARVCKYRAPNGLKCFIGELIPDEIYYPEMEGHAIHGLFNNFQQVKDLFPGIGIGILKELQTIHDGLPEDVWDEELENLENKYCI